MIGIHTGIPGTARRLSAFSPLSLSPFAWYRADLLVSSGGRVTQWTDKSGNGRHLTASGVERPTLATAVAAFGGHDAVDFSTPAATPALEATTTVAADWAFGHNSTGATVWGVTRSLSGVLGWLLNTQGGSGAGRGFSLIGDYPVNDSWRYVIGDGAGNAPLVDCACLDGTARIFEIQYGTQAGDDQRFFEGATQMGSTAGLASPSSADPVSRLIVGNWTGKVNSFNGQVVELLFFNRLLTTQERADLAAYKLARYG